MPHIAVAGAVDAPRQDLPAADPETYRAMLEFSTVAGRRLDPALAELVRVRVSQLNGCGFCLDMHGEAARRAGVDVRKLVAVGAWRLTPFFDARERSALALAEAVTLLAGPGAAQDAHAEAASLFADEELAGLLWTIAAINAWNRVAVTTHTTPAP